jgi:CRISPR-associated protein Csb2
MMAVIGIECRFLAGRYHATPWNRHVNEGEVEWPPSAWRVLRTLIGAWHRYSLAEEFEEDTLRRVVLTLASDAPVYALPAAVHAHSRHYMPAGMNETTLVFDSFLRCPDDAILGMYWPNVRIGGEERRLLERLVEAVSYLGRAESWVEARVVDAPSPSVSINARPVEDPAAADWATRPDVEVVQSLAPLAPEEYALWRERHGAEMDAPEDLYTALQVSTRTLEAKRQNMPAGARWRVYYRLAPRSTKPGARVRAPRAAGPVNCARYALTSRVTPRLVDCLDIAEVIHLALLEKCKENAPHIISGREDDGAVSTRGHQHLFILPEDANGDGRIDHVTLFAAEPFPPSVLEAIQSLRHLHTPAWWPGPARHWEVYLEGLFSTDRTGASPVGVTVLGPARVWRSVTPYLHPWHVKRNGKFGPPDQLAKELQLRGLPAPVRITKREFVECRGTRLSPHRFRRLRHAKRQNLPDTRGSFWEIEFAAPVQGPLCLGSNAHFGMGMFVPVTN